MELDISGLDKASVLAALYNAARPKGLGFLRYDPKPITKEEAQEIIKRGDDLRVDFGFLGPEYYETYCFDYVNGRPLKVELTFDQVSTYAFDECNGEKMAQRAIQHLRDTGEVACQDIIDIQNKMIIEEAFRILDVIDYCATINFFGVELTIGFGSHKEELQAAIKETIAKIPM